MSKNSVSEDFSKKVTLVSFGLSILVMYIHANNISYYSFDGNTQTIAHMLVDVIARTLGGLAVPMFFILSGYWLFRFEKVESVKNEALLIRLKKKIRTLVIPYLLWNTLYMTFYMVITRIPFLANMMSNGTIEAINAQYILKNVFLHASSFHLWYLQDLIILSCVSPIILKILQKREWGRILIAVSLVISVMKVDLKIIGDSSLFFYTLGGYYAMYKKDYFEKRNKDLTILLVFIVAIIIRYLDIALLNRLCYCLLPILMWRVFDFIISSSILKREIGWFKTQSFFIYAVHVIPVTTIGHILAKINGGGYWAALSYLVAPWITLAMIYALSAILHKIAPSFYNILCGDRDKKRG